MEIIWTRMARITNLETLENLQKYWAEKEVEIFNRLTVENLSQITSGKIFHSLVQSQPKIHRVVLHPNVALC